MEVGGKLGLKCGLGRKTRFRMGIRGEKLGLECGLEEKTWFRVWIREEN